MTPLATYIQRRFDSTTTFTLFSDQIEMTSSDIMGTEHQAAYPLRDFKEDQQTMRCWNRWYRRGVMSACVATTTGLSREMFPVDWQNGIGGACLLLLFFGLACIFGNRRHDNWRAFTFVDGRVLWLCDHRKDRGEFAIFIAALTQAIATTRQNEVQKIPPQ